MITVAKNDVVDSTNNSDQLAIDILNMKVGDSMLIDYRMSSDFFNPTQHQMMISRRWEVMKFHDGWIYNEIDDDDNIIPNSGFQVPNSDKQETFLYGVWHRTDPKRKGIYIAMLYNGYIKSAIWNGTKWVDFFNKKRFKHNVIGWMYIPTGIKQKRTNKIDYK